MQCYKVNIDTKKIKRSLVDLNDKGIFYFKNHRIRQYNIKIDYKGILYNFFANCPSFYTASFIINSILKDGIKYPVGLYLDDYKINCHPGMRRLLCSEFLGNIAIEGIIVEKNLNYKYFNSVELMELSNINFYKNKKGKYEYLPQDVVKSKSTYPEFILSNFNKTYPLMFSSIKSINIITEYLYDSENLYFPDEDLSVDWDRLYTKKRKVIIDFNGISNNYDIVIILKKRLKVNFLELLYFLHPDYYCHQDEKNDIIIYNNTSNSDNILIIPESYIKKACYDT